MRYVIDTKKETIEELQQKNAIELIDSYEPIERLTTRVEKMHQAFKEFKNNRGSWKILNYYLRGRGLSQNEIDSVTDGIEEFLKLV